MAITYNAGTNTITVTGYTEAVPCNFTDIYNADVAGGWGKVTRQCTNQFCFNCKLQIGDGSTATWFADTEKQIILSNILSVNWDKFILVKNNAHFRIGTLVDAAKKTTKDGCCILAADQTAAIWIYVLGDTSADINMYSTQVVSIRGGSYAGWLRLKNSNNRVWNCIFNGEGANNDGTGNFYNIIVQNGYAGLSKTTGTVDSLTITDCSAGLHWTNALGGDVSNCVIKDCTHDFSVNSVTIDIDVLNIECGWIFNFTGVCTKKVYRQYEFDLKVIDKDNAAINAATVKIWDKDSTLIVDTTTNASGVIATQTTTRGYYNQANGSTLQEASPHLIKIEKAGYTTYEADFTLEDKTDWLIALQVGGGLLRNPPMTGGMV